MLSMIFNLDSVFLELLNKGVSDVLSGNLKLDLSMRKSIAFKYWYSVRETFS